MTTRIVIPKERLISDRGKKLILQQNLKISMPLTTNW